MKSLISVGVKKLTVIFLFVLSTQTSASKTQDSSKLMTTYYWDERGFNTTNLLYSSKALPYGLSFWGFTDFHTAQEGDQSRQDTTSFFTEARLTKFINDGWAFQLEYNDASGSGNNLGRLGLVYKFPATKKLLMLRVFPVETDGDGGQVSFVWKTLLGLNNLYFEGFVDYNISEQGKNRIVSEPQLRYMMTERFGLTVEYRVNEFLKNSTKDHQGLALGAFYHF